MQDFYNNMIVHGGNVKLLMDPTMDTGMARLAIGMKREYSRIHEHTRASFWRAFGIEPQKQVAIEELYRSVTYDYTVNRRHTLTEGVTL